MEMTREEACKAAGLEPVDNRQPMSTQNRVAMALITGVGAATIGRVVLDNGKPLDAPQAAALAVTGIGVACASFAFSDEIETNGDEVKTMTKQVGIDLGVFTLGVVAGKAIAKLLL